MIRFIKELKELFTKKPKWRIDVEEHRGEEDKYTLYYQVQRWRAKAEFYEDVASFDDYDKALQFIHDYNAFPHYFDELGAQ
jgi:hypothetical protein